jgi:HlyD family secretion protein
LNAASALSSSSGSSSGQSATQFQVRIHVTDKEEFRPGMSVNATIETRTRTNAIAAPIASVTTRVIKPKLSKDAVGKTNGVPTNAVVAVGTNGAASGSSNVLAAASQGTNSVKGDKKGEEKNKPTEVVFVVEGDHVKAVPVKIGIFDDDYYEITDGLKEGDEIVIGGFRAISHDLDDGKKVVKETGGEIPEKNKS